jgi:hypothetical protein
MFLRSSYCVPLSNAIATQTLEIFRSDVAQIAQQSIGVLAEQRRAFERHA